MKEKKGDKVEQLRRETERLQKRIFSLESELTEAQDRIKKLADLSNKYQGMITELEARVNGQFARELYIQRLDPTGSLSEGNKLLCLLEGQEGFLGGRVIGGDEGARVQSFWRDSYPPATWLGATILNDTLPTEFRYVQVPMALQKSLFMIRPFDESHNSLG